MVREVWTWKRSITVAYSCAATEAARNAMGVIERIASVYESKEDRDAKRETGRDVIARWRRNERLERTETLRKRCYTEILSTMWQVIPFHLPRS